MSQWECPLCGCGEARQLFDSTDLTSASAETWCVVECCGCSLHSLSPRPSRADLLALYPPDYDPFRGPVDDEPSWVRRWLRQRHYALRCQAVRHARPQGGRLLDIGCATGNFAHELCRDGQWKVIGVDVNWRALTVARHQEVPVWCGESDELCLSAASCDVITLWEVIEHVPDPRTTLIEARRILRPGGTLLLSTPNSACWQARLWHRCWAGWEVPRHLQVFSPQTLLRLLRETGFEVIRRVFFPMERFYAVESARRWLSIHLDGRTGTIAQRLTQAAGLAAWPLLRIADYMPTAASLALEARALRG